MRCKLHGRDDGADVGRFVERVADASASPCARLQLGDEARARRLSATSSREPAQQTWPWLNQMRVDDALDRAVEIGVVEHDERRFAAKLQRQLLARCPPSRGG